MTYYDRVTKIVEFCGYRKYGICKKGNNMADKKEKILLTHEECINRALNFRIIQTAWKMQKGEYGVNDIAKHKNDFDNLYGSLEKSRQSIRMISRMEGQWSKATVEKWAEKVSDKTGIPKKYLTGEELIVIDEEWAEIIVDKFEDFVEACDEINDIRKKAKDEDGKIRQIKMSLTSLKKLVIEEKGKEEGEKLLKKAEEATIIYNEFEANLKHGISKMLGLRNFNTIADKDVVRVFYFIKTGKHYDKTSIARIPEIIDAMSNVHTDELVKLGEQALDNYIEKLECQLQLAKAVRTVAKDTKTF